MALLTLKDVGKIYVSAENVTVGIRGVNLSFDTGEFVAVTGKSGSGKSTLLNVISGMDSYEEGELYIEGQPTSHYLEPDWEGYREKYISFIFQDYNIIESFTVLQNVELALMNIEDKRERRERALTLIEKVGLSSHVNHKGSRLCNAGVVIIQHPLHISNHIQLREHIRRRDMGTVSQADASGVTGICLCGHRQ